MALGNARVTPSATTLTTLYTATSDTVISSIVIANTSSTATSFRVALRPLGASIDISHYIYYDINIDGNDTFILTGGITMINTDVISVYATLGTLSFNLFYTK